MRRALVLLHRYVGLTIAGFLILAGLTGAVIAFERELDAALNPDLFRATMAGARLPYDELAARVEAQLPGMVVTAIRSPTAPGESVYVRIRPRDGDHAPYDEAFVDPASGQVLGARMWGACCFERRHLIPFIFKLHYTLHLPGAWGAWVMGGVAMAWALDGFVALALSAPKGARQLVGWARAMSVKWRGGAYRRTFDLHRASGLWLWPVLITLAVSGVALNLREPVFKPLVGVFADFEADPPPRTEDPQADAAPGLGFDAAILQAQASAGPLATTGRVTTVQHDPASGEYGLAVSATRDPRAGLGPTWIWIDERDGRLLRIERPDGGALGDLILAIQRPLHTGLILGRPGQIAVSGAGIVTAGLSLTGLLIWSRKRRARSPR